MYAKNDRISIILSAGDQKQRYYVRGTMSIKSGGFCVHVKHYFMIFNIKGEDNKNTSFFTILVTLLLFYVITDVETKQ